MFTAAGGHQIYRDTPTGVCARIHTRVHDNRYSNNQAFCARQPTHIPAPGTSPKPRAPVGMPIDIPVGTEPQARTRKTRTALPCSHAVPGCVDSSEKKGGGNRQGLTRRSAALSGVAVECPTAWGIHGHAPAENYFGPHNAKAPRKIPGGFQNRWHYGQKPRLKKSIPPAKMQSFSLAKRCLLQSGAGNQGLCPWLASVGLRSRNAGQAGIRCCRDGCQFRT